MKPRSGGILYCVTEHSLQSSSFLQPGKRTIALTIHNNWWKKWSSWKRTKDIDWCCDIVHKDTDQRNTRGH